MAFSDISCVAYDKRREGAGGRGGHSFAILKTQVWDEWYLSVIINDSPSKF